MQIDLFAPAEDERPKAPETWLDRYHAYQAECHARGEVCQNVSDWRREHAG